jgi:anti-sigma factor RsiW
VTDPMTTIAPIGDDDLQAWADRRMPLDRRDAIEAYLAAHPEVVTRMARYAVHDAGLAAALQPKFEEPIPARLRIETLLAGRRSRMTAHLARAAGLLLMKFGRTRARIWCNGSQTAWSGPSRPQTFPPSAGGSWADAFCRPRTPRRHK